MFAHCGHQGGTISKDELKQLMTTLGLKPSKEELDAMVDEIDSDGNGGAQTQPPQQQEPECQPQRQQRQQQQQQQPRWNHHQQQPHPERQLVQNHISHCHCARALRSWDHSRLLTPLPVSAAPALAEIDFDEFVTVMSRKVNTAYTPAQVKAAFKVFEKEAPNGFVTMAALEQALTTYGTEKLSLSDAQELLSQIEPDENGLINCTSTAAQPQMRLSTCAVSLDAHP